MVEEELVEDSSKACSITNLGIPGAVIMDEQRLIEFHKKKENHFLSLELHAKILVTSAPVKDPKEM